MGSVFETGVMHVYNFGFPCLAAQCAEAVPRLLGRLQLSSSGFIYFEYFVSEESKSASPTTGGTKIQRACQHPPATGLRSYGTKSRSLRYRVAQLVQMSRSSQKCDMKKVPSSGAINIRRNCTKFCSPGDLESEICATLL
jgi:hypothetical protein